MRRFTKLLMATIFLSMLVHASTPSAFAPFAGQWQGTLDYQDYRGPGRIKIPVTLEVIPVDDTQAAWNFDYDDFGRSVLSLETHTWRDGTYTVETKGQADVQTYQSADFTALLENNTGQAILIGSELDDGKEVEVRRTITLGTTTLTTLKEIRVPGEEAYTFRNQSTYTRVQ
jgi:hypothetical protein